MLDVRERDLLIADGLHAVALAHAEGTPERVGAERGLEMCRALNGLDEFAAVVRARERREQRMVTGFHDGLDPIEFAEREEAFGPAIRTSEEDYLQHRAGTRAIQAVAQRLAALEADG